jgi:hypothetical protein
MDDTEISGDLFYKNTVKITDKGFQQTAFIFDLIFFIKTTLTVVKD